MKRAPHINSIEILLFFILLASVILFVGPISGRINHSLDEMKKSLLLSIEERTGLRVSCASLSPSVFRSLQLTNLVLSDAATGAVLARFSDISVSYNIVPLLKGDFQNALRSVVIKNGIVSVDLTQNLLSVSRLQGKNSGAGTSNQGQSTPLSALFSEKPVAITIRNIDITYNDQNQLMFAHISKGTARMDIDGVTFDLDCKVRYSRSNLASLGELSSNVRLHGTIDKNLENGTASLILKTLEGKTFSVNRLGLITSYRKGILSINTVQDLQPIDIRLMWNRPENTLAASMTCDRLLPFRWIRIKNENSTFGKLQDTVLTGNATLQYTGQEGLTYSTSLNASVPQSFHQGGTIRLEASGTNSQINFQELLVKGPDYDIFYDGSFDLKTRSPDGLLAIKKLTLSAGTRFSGDLFFKQELEGFSCLIPEFSVNSNVFTTVEVQIDLKKSAIEFSLSADDQRGHLNIEGSYTREAKSFLQLYGTFDSISVSSTISTILGIAKPSMINIRDKLEHTFSGFALTTEIYFSTDFSDISFNSNRLVLASTETEGLFVLLSVKGNQDGIDVTDINFSRAGITITGDIYTVFEDSGEILFDSSLTANTIPYSLSGMYSNDILSLYGDYNLALSAYFNPEGGISGSVRATSFPVPIKSVLLSTSFDAGFLINTDASWKIVLNKCLVEEMSGLLPLATILSLEGSIDTSGIFMDRVSISDEISQVTGYASINKLAGSERRYTAEVELQSTETTESYQAKGLVTLADEVYFESRISITESPLIRFLKTQKKENNISLELTCSGTTESLFASLDVNHIIYRVGGFNLDARGRLLVEDRDISVMDGVGSWNGQTFENLAGTLSMDTLNAELKTEYRGVFGKSGVSASVDVLILPDSATIPRTIAEIITVFNEFTVKSTVSNLKWRNIVTKEPLLCTFVREPGITAVYAGTNDSVNGFLLDDGTFSLQADKTVPVSFKADGTILNSVVAIQVTGLHSNLAKFWPYLGFDTVVFESGFIDGDLEITGLLNDPEFDGELRATEVKVRSPDYLPDAYGPLTISFLADGKILTVPEFLLSGKNGAFTVQAFMEFDRWIPDVISIKTATLPGKMLKIDTDNYLIRAQGYTSFDIGLNITQEIIEVEGYTSFERGSFAIQFANLTKPPKTDVPQLFDILLNLDINVGKKVEFRWPTFDFPILSGLLQVHTPIKLALDTSNNSFTIKGAADLKGGEIFYIKRSFYLRQGTISFNENQDIFDPIISFRAEIRERDAHGEPVRIIMTVDQQPLNSFIPVLSSDPPKSDIELMALLGQAASGDTSRDSILRNTVIATSDIFTQMSIFRNVENQMRDWMHLDIFSIRTLILQNAIFGQSMQNSSDAPMTIGNYFDNTTVYMGKYLGSAIYADALMHFSYYDPLSAQNTGKTQGVYGNLLFQPELGLEMTTPFFLLRWGVSPSRLDTLFVSDNSLTFSWKFSY